MAEYDRSPRGAAKKRAASRQKTARARKTRTATLAQLRSAAGVPSGRPKTKLEREMADASRRLAEKRKKSPNFGKKRKRVSQKKYKY